MIKIIQANLNRCRAAQDLLLQYEVEKRVGISIITEPNRVPDDSTWVCSEDRLSAIHWNPRYTPGCGVMLEKRQHSISLGWNNFKIIATYISPNVDDDGFIEYLDELEEMIQRMGANVIIGGDFNSWNMLWGSKRTDGRGDRLSRWAAAQDIRLINEGSIPTCVRAQGQSVVDLTWATADISPKIKSWTVLDELTLSDHKYIYYEIHVRRSSEDLHRKKYPRWSYKKMDIDMFKETLEWTSTSEPPNANAEGRARWIQEILTEACNNSMPKVKVRAKTCMYWWNDTIARLRIECNKARKKWQKAKNKRREILTELVEKENIYREAKNELRIEINRAKGRAWNELIRDIESNPWGLPYKLVLKKLRRTSPGITEQMEQSVLNYTIERLFPSDDEWHLGREMIESDELEEPITPAEVHQVVRKRMVVNKAPGADGIKAIYLKKVPDATIDSLVSCFNACIKEGKFPRVWKQAVLVLIPKGTLDLKDPKVRPICLLNETGKILERVLANRIDQWMTNNDNSQLSRNQFGFRRGKSTCDALWQMQQNVTLATKEKDIMVGISLDISNAFNAIRWMHIRKALKDKGFPLYIQRLINDYLSERSIEFPVMDGTTQTRKVTSGVPQGSVLGPVLWNITYDWALRTPLERGCSIIGYADDTMILVRASNIEEAICKGNLQISKTLKRIKKLDLSVAEAKTEIVIFQGPRMKIPRNIFRVGHTQVKAQESLKYLGLMLDERWSFKDHINYTEEKTTKVIRALGRLMPNLRGPGETKRRLYAYTITSVITYGAPIWSEAVNGSKKLQERLKQIQRSIALRTIAAYRTVSADAALALSRIPPAMIHASYIKKVYHRVRELKDEGIYNKKEEAEIKEEERILLNRQWRLYMERPSVAGKRTCEAIAPHLTNWIDRKHGELTYRITQILTGHGCFYSFLHRIGKANTSICPYCQQEEDTSEHTLQRCSKWDRERSELNRTIGPDLQLDIIIRSICDSEEVWESFRKFAETVMSIKEDDERERQRREREEVDF